MGDKSEFFRVIAISWALLFHLCFECLNAQKLIDYSGYLYSNLYVSFTIYYIENGTMESAKI